jgi:hypothetical protein
MKYKSEICEVMYQDALADFEVGAISEARMREYDEMCLVQTPKTACKTGQPTAKERTSPARIHGLPGLPVKKALRTAN